MLWRWQADCGRSVCLVCFYVAGSRATPYKWLLDYITQAKRFVARSRHFMLLPNEKYTNFWLK